MGNPKFFPMTGWPGCWACGAEPVDVADAQVRRPRVRQGADHDLSHCIFIWDGCRQLFIFLRRRFPRYNQTAAAAVPGAAILLFTLVVAFFMNWICHTFWPNDPTPTTVFQDFREGHHPDGVRDAGVRKRVFLRRVEKQREENRVAGPRNVQSQLDALRNQLDPHFLFNSLNTLASLIDFENDEAQQYLERLSDVYRYVLVSRDKNTVTLEEEIAFLDAYVYLNKVRFRDNLQGREGDFARGVPAAGGPAEPANAGGKRHQAQRGIEGKAPADPHRAGGRHVPVGGQQRAGKDHHREVYQGGPPEHYQPLQAAFRPAGGDKPEPRRVQSAHSAAATGPLLIRGPRPAPSDQS
jgi:hypothetical protein